MPTGVYVRSPEGFIFQNLPNYLLILQVIQLLSCWLLVDGLVLPHSELAASPANDRRTSAVTAALKQMTVGNIYFMNRLNNEYGRLSYAD
jgi:hypothetical protein